jgi:GTP-binding protein
MSGEAARVRGASFVAAANTIDALPPPLYAEVAFAGRSNVGKSSLLNALVGQRALARTSRTPGRTGALVLFRVELATAAGGATIDFVDLPGYGFARRSKKERRAWGPMIDAFLERRAGLRCVVLLVDARRGMEPDDVDLLTFLRDLRRDAIVVATKIDKFAPSRRKPALAAIARDVQSPVIAFSAATGEGRDALWRVLFARAGIGRSVGLEAQGRANQGQDDDGD